MSAENSSSARPQTAEITRLRHKLSLAEQHQAQQLTLQDALLRLNHWFTHNDDLESISGNILQLLLELFDAQNIWLLRPGNPSTSNYFLQTLSKTASGQSSTEYTHLNYDPELQDYLTTAFRAGGPFSFCVGLAPYSLRTGSYRQCLLPLQPNQNSQMLIGLEYPANKQLSCKQVKAMIQLASSICDGIFNLQRFNNMRVLLENSDIAIWNEDLSAVVGQLSEISSQGIEDLDSYLDEHPQILEQMLNSVRLLDANQSCHQLFLLRDHEHFIRFSEKLTAATSLEDFRAKLLAIWRGDTSFKSEIQVENAFGNNVHAILNLHIPATPDGFASIPISVIDITERKNTELELKETLLRYELVVEGTYGAIWDWDVANQTVHFSKAWCDLRGYEQHEVTNRQEEWINSIHPDDRDKALAAVQAHFDDKDVAFKEEYRIICKDGSYKWVFDQGVAKRDSEGRIIRMAGSEVDITERRQYEERLRLAASVFENAAQGVIILDSNGNIINTNQACYKILGYELIGQSPDNLALEADNSTGFADIWQALQDNHEWQGETRSQHANGDLIPGWLTISTVFDADQPTHYVCLLSDISHIKHSEALLYQLAHHDALTGLPNRLLLTEQLEQAIARAQRQETMVAVIFVDLDNFKFINDSLGHSAGDQLLKTAADTLKASVRTEDNVARIGGDEFILTMEGITHVENVAHVADHVLHKITQRFRLQERDIRVSASLGVAIYPQDGEDPDTLIKNADAAMYRAKQAGRQNYQFYTEELTQQAFERMQLETDLHQALNEGAFSLHYQPQIDLHTGRIIGLEALIRWQHPRHGMIPPDKFIPLAEETGLIDPLSDWVLHNACLQIRQWLDEGLKIDTIAVNISTRQIQKEGLIDMVRNALSTSGLPAHHLELEVTEGCIMQHTEFAITQLEQLRNLGVNLAIDDFGTGYSSLSYLKSLPIHRLKIDKSFVSDIPGDQNDTAITEAIIAMAERLELNVIAEGVETKAQADFLKTQGCYEAQGYLFSKPLDSQATRQLLLQDQPFSDS